MRTDKFTALLYLYNGLPLQARYMLNECVLHRKNRRGR